MLHPPPLVAPTPDSACVSWVGSRNVFLVCFAGLFPRPAVSLNALGTKCDAMSQRGLSKPSRDRFSLCCSIQLRPRRPYGRRGLS
eukprot:3875227-Alexandrium_andersonii.AAC.1